MTRMATSSASVEYAAARSAVGLIDRREHGVLEATGRDRASFLNALLSNDVKSLAAGQGCAATLLDVHGKVQVVLLVWVLDDRILIVTPPGAAASTLEALDRYLFSEKVELRDASGAWALFLLIGPGVFPDFIAFGWIEALVAVGMFGAFSLCVLTFLSAFPAVAISAGLPIDPDTETLAELTEPHHH